MTVPELDNLVRVNQLKVEAGTQSEFDGRYGDRRVAACRVD